MEKGYRKTVNLAIVVCAYGYIRTYIYLQVLMSNTSISQYFSQPSFCEHMHVVVAFDTYLVGLYTCAYPTSITVSGQ
ncbi:hypothetical protein EYC84_006708 [Monilinia fructicola]|uniref:Uncharacterized protein n=1 Tax=Monilinia fructicola TaxID=38448 RepID=A0A5M9K4S9_MONFR|nr:hypothetical protein EYC84_006708 [Monilinia fructicola]